MPRWRSRSTWRIRGSRNSSSRRCSPWKAASTSGACASCVTKPATWSTTPTSCACRRQRRALFGNSSEAYPEFYTPKPYSKSFVLHLDPWYAQSHPDEDFAETFALWLTPQSNWQQRYAGWPAIKKLEYMDELMQSLAGQAPKVASGDEVEPLRGHRETLRAYYRRKRRHYGVDHPAFYDRDLRRLFSDAPEHHDRPTAAHFIRAIGAPCAGSSPSGRAFTSTRSTRSSKT